MNPPRSIMSNRSIVSLFQGRRIINDFRIDFINSTSYRWKALATESPYTVWLKYYSGDTPDSGEFDVKDLCQAISIPSSLVYFQKKGSEAVSYEYAGSVIVNRKKDGNIRIDIIVNIDDILHDIESFICEMENAPG